MSNHEPARQAIENASMTPLVGAMRNEARLVQLGLQRGGDVNVNEQDQEGMTALHHAAALGNRECLRLLVDSGRCDFLIQDRQERYASDLAIEWARDYAVGRWLTQKQIQQAERLGTVAAIALRGRGTSA